MQLDLKLVLRAGIVWGIIAVLLMLAATLLSGILPIPVDAVALGTFAALFAGVHFAHRSTDGHIIVAIVGGAIAGIIVALFMFAVSLIVSRVGLGEVAFGLNDTGALIGALVAGLFGALGFQIVKRL